MQEALELFAIKGYAAVSMRDIARAVGIRPSSIYYHFKGKQELFDALIQKANDIKNSLQEVFLNAFANGLISKVGGPVDKVLICGFGC